ncbi:MAG: zinc-binding dehydrogenase [Sphaerochaetaceae bacterium]|jgi:threonine dehydrogenase-like Zn-dependent dehydrogenase|nr:zinc-binding dehydrogenase [Sphaerochaetaceae bacterium]NLY08053.1 alcohol dehydrogenase catalytic domain-containing protein [Spirochaetales bacterium]
MKTIYYEKNILKILLTKLNAKYFKGLLFSGLNAVKYDRRLPDPKLPSPSWVKVRNIQAGVCGTDLSFFKSTPGTSIALEPMPGSEVTFLGHETIGVVEEVGKEVTKFKVGDRVTLMEYMSCCGNKDIRPLCPECAQGDYCLCENYGEKSPLSLPMTGAGFGDYYLAPEHQLCKVFDELDDDQATLIEPTAVSLHAVLRHTPKPGEKVMVLGAGTIGLGIIQCLKIIQPKCRIYVMERIPSKQEFALKLGADEIIKGEPYFAIAKATDAKVYEGMFHNKMMMGGFDVIYDCVGSKWAFQNCLRWLHSRGTLVKVGHHMCPTEYDETPIWWQELNIVGIDAHGMEHVDGRDITTFDYAQELIRDGKYRTEGFITHRFKLDDYKKAFKVMIENPPELIKIVLECK